MQWHEYEQLAVRTKSDRFDIGNVSPDILHGVLGAATESAEMADNVKRAIFYGKKLDLINLREELGDLCWYIAIVCAETGFNFGEILERNIDKLRQRYPEKFSTAKALNRDLDAERAVLEGGK